MAKWIYTCKGGKELRNLIDRSGAWEMSVEIIKQLQRCYQEIINHYPWEDEYDKDEFQEALDCLNGDDDIIIDWMNSVRTLKNMDLKLMKIWLTQDLKSSTTCAMNTKFGWRCKHEENCCYIISR